MGPGEVSDEKTRLEKSHDTVPLSVKKIGKFTYSTETVLATNTKKDNFIMVLHDFLDSTPRCWVNCCRAISCAQLAYLYLYLPYDMAPKVLAQHWLG